MMATFNEVPDGLATALVSLPRGQRVENGRTADRIDDRKERDEGNAERAGHPPSA
jgi:hypothetical protein